jgi:hypothetical protein
LFSSCSKLLDSGWTLVARRFNCLAAWLFVALSSRCCRTVVALSLAAFAAVEVCSTQVGRAVWLFVALSSRCRCTVVALLLAAFAADEVCSTQVGRAVWLFVALSSRCCCTVVALLLAAFAAVEVVGGRFTTPVRRSSLVEDNRSYEKDDWLCTVVTLLLFALSLVVCRCRCLFILHRFVRRLFNSCSMLVRLKLYVCRSEILNLHR